MANSWLDAIKWTDDGLVAVIAQEQHSHQVLMQAWMNRDALQQTIDSGKVHYWSRSRQKMWLKGESSGHTQHLKAIYLDCDGDTLLLSVEQEGGIACHTGRHHCFFRQLDDQQTWQNISEVIKDPKDIYR